MKKQKKEIQNQKKKSFNDLIANPWVVIFIFFISTLLAYSNSFNVPFQFDDHNQISLRESCHSFDIFKNFKTWININERPVSFFTIALNYFIHGEKVLGYHIVNFLIHLFSGIVLYFWFSLILKSTKTLSNKEWLPFVVSLFFLLHPVQTQSVTYIIQRMSSLAGLFFILSALFYTWGRILFFTDRAKYFSLSLIAFSLLSGVLASLSKQNAVVFPFTLLLIEIFFIRNKDGAIDKKFLFISSALIFIVFITGFLKFGLPAETTKISPLDYLATQMYVIPRYFQMMLIPIGLSIDHGVKIADGFLSFKVISGIFILLSIIGYGIFMLKRSKIVSFGIFWIFITLLIESSVIPITDPMFDQRMYLPLVGFAIAFFGILDFYILSRKPELIKPISVSILLLLSVLTFSRNVLWNDRISIWTDVTQKYPDYTRGWLALGKMYKDIDGQNPQMIIDCFEKAEALDPENDEIKAELGFHYLKANNEEKAIECYLFLLNSKDKNFRIQAMKVLSAYNAAKGNDDEAIRYLKTILSEKPYDEEANKSFFSYYFEKKDYNNAAKTSLDWIKSAPNSSEAHFLTGKAYFYMNERTIAKEYFQKALNIEPNHVEAMLLYSNSCINTFEYDLAIEYLEKAYSITKNNSILKNIEIVKQLKGKIN